jgi:hypothetical protein
VSEKKKETAEKPEIKVTIKVGKKKRKPGLSGYNLTPGQSTKS